MEHNGSCRFLLQAEKSRIKVNSRSGNNRERERKNVALDNCTKGNVDGFRNN
jgi:hypothetical protein